MTIDSNLRAMRWLIEDGNTFHYVTLWLVSLDILHVHVQFGNDNNIEVLHQEAIVARGVHGSIDNDDHYNEAVNSFIYI